MTTRERVEMALVAIGFVLFSALIGVGIGLAIDPDHDLAHDMLVGFGVALLAVGGTFLALRLKSD